MVAADIFEPRYVLIANIHTMGTSGMKGTAGRWIDRAGHIAFENHAFSFALGSGTGMADSNARVYGCFGSV